MSRTRRSLVLFALLWAPAARAGAAADGPQSAPGAGDGGAPAEPGKPGEAGWKLAEGVLVQAGDDVVTLGELERFVRRRSVEVGIQIDGPEALEGYLREALRPVVTQELEVQAGQDLGLDPARIEGAVRQTLETRRRELGPKQYRDFLQSEGVDGIQIGVQQQDAIYRQAWIAKQLGYDTTGERPIRDRYVRPGEMRAIYHTNKDGMGTPARVRFQDLLVPVEALGGDVERTRALVKTAREQALGGEPFDNLVEEFGFSNQEALGVTDWLEARRLSDDGLRAFALEQPVGSYTEVLPIVQRGETVAFHVVKLLEREDGSEPPSFADPRAQRFLRREYQRLRDEKILESERARLSLGAVHWHAPGWEPDLPQPSQAPPQADAPEAP